MVLRTTVFTTPAKPLVARRFGLLILLRAPQIPLRFLPQVQPRRLTWWSALPALIVQATLLALVMLRQLQMEQQPPTGPIHLVRRFGYLYLQLLTAGEHSRFV